MTGPHEDAPQTPLLRLLRRRPNPRALLVLALGTLVVLWAVLQLSLSLVGIATSPVGWLFSILGTITGFVFGRAG